MQINKMQNRSISLRIRNHTLPLKSSNQIRSATRIKISTKGLPQDFFQPEFSLHFLKPLKNRSKTQGVEQIRETSRFGLDVTSNEPRKQGRQYKSQQRKGQSVQRLAKKPKQFDFAPMECTFYPRGSPQRKPIAKPREPYSERLIRKGKQDPVQYRKQDLSSIFQTRMGNCELGFQRLKTSANRGPLPLIRFIRKTAQQ